MLKPSLLVSDKNPARSLLAIAVNIGLGFLLIGPLIGVLVAMLVYDGDFSKDMMDFSTTHPGIFYAVMIAQGLGSLIGLIVIPFTHLKLIEGKSLKPFFPNQPRTAFMLVIVVLLGFNFIIFTSPIAEWNMHWKFPEFLSGFEEWARAKEDELAELVKMLTTFKTVPDLMLGVLVIAVIPAIGEELVFRGILQHELWRGTKNIHIAIWLSAIIFSAIHLQFYGFMPRLLLGALFGYLYYFSGNLLIPMAAHFVNNALALIGVYLYQKGTLTTNIEEIDAAPWPAVIFSGVITVGLLYYVWKSYRDESETPPGQPISDL